MALTDDDSPNASEGSGEVAVHNENRDIHWRELVHPRVLSVLKVFEEYGRVRTGDPDPPPRPADFSSYDGATAYLRVVLAGSPGVDPVRRTA